VVDIPRKKGGRFCEKLAGKMSEFQENGKEKVEELSDRDWRCRKLTGERKAKRTDEC
jgi:hypothetical protein